MAGQRFLIEQNQPDSHQSVPWCIAHFMSFAVRDTFYKTDGEVNSETKMRVNNYTIVSDIMNCKVESSKSSPMMTAELTLSSGDFNYQSLLTPGDHCAIWMHNDPGVFERISNQLISLPSRSNPKDKHVKYANDQNSGLKFVGRVNSVRSVYRLGAGGIKTLTFMVTLKGFSELQSMVYFNPLLSPKHKENNANEKEDNKEAVFNEIATEWNSYLTNEKSNRTVTGLLDFLIDIFLGKGPKITSVGQKNDKSPNAAFLMPSFLTKMLGIDSPSKPTKYSDILHTMIGIQKYNESYVPLNLKKQTVTQRVGENENQLLGNLVTLPDQFNNVTIWSLLHEHSNLALNEMYVAMRMNDKNRIVPTLIIRQIPFTSKKFVNANKPKNVKGHKFNADKDAPYTEFLSLPVWEIDPTMVISSYNIGTSDSTRFNFFQVYGQYLGFGGSPQDEMQRQIAQGNYRIDSLDIARHGTRSFITTTNASFNSGNSRFENPGKWAELVADWYANSQLKLTGSITCPGIPDPICIGDNLQFDGTVFHIESCMHYYEVAEGKNAVKTFTSSLALSNGVLADTGSYYFKKGDFRENIKDNPMAPGYSDMELGANLKTSNSHDGPERHSRKPGIDEQETHRKKPKTKGKKK